MAGLTIQDVVLFKLEALLARRRNEQGRCRVSTKVTSETSRVHHWMIRPLRGSSATTIAPAVGTKVMSVNMDRSARIRSLFQFHRGSFSRQKCAVNPK